ncbi:MAG TPA: PIN domain-containing protein [Methanothrix sp.]|nr:PIN domain-containing protein [Methanothrix sp.]
MGAAAEREGGFHTSGRSLMQVHHGDMKVYMDVCCLCRPFDDRAQDRIRIESEAVLTILGRCNDDWTLVGSEAIDFELSAVTDQKKRSDAFFLSSLATEKIMIDKSIIKRASELEKLGFKSMDAVHISCAERAADIMFTVDDDVLRVARIKQNQIYIEIESPLRWLINVFQD